jgi:uncharacterized membrane protein YoaK (UPF0700 family)
MAGAAPVTAPPRPGEHPLLAPLLLLTFTTGIIDAVSFVALGHVFTANMTGNVVFIGFALAGVEGMSLARSTLALAAFATGAAGGGVLIRRTRSRHGRLLAQAAAAEAVTVAGSAALALAAPLPADGTVFALIVSTAAAIGLRTAVVRAIAVPDVTTTVLTLTVTGLAADAVTGTAARTGRRVAAVALMLAGAATGALALGGMGAPAPLTLSAAAAAVAAALAWRADDQ